MTRRERSAARGTAALLSFLFWRSDQGETIKEVVAGESFSPSAEKDA